MAWVRVPREEADRALLSNLARRRARRGKSSTPKARGYPPAVRQVRIGWLAGARVTIDVHGRRFAHPSDGAGYDALECTVRIEIGGWSGRFRAWMWPEEFLNFLQGVRTLHSSPPGKAEFLPIDYPAIVLKLEGDPLGHIAVTGQASDGSWIDGNRLEFGFEIDQTFLPTLIDDLEGVLTEFPARER